MDKDEMIKAWAVLKAAKELLTELYDEYDTVPFRAYMDGTAALAGFMALLDAEISSIQLDEEMEH